MEEVGTGVFEEAPGGIRATLKASGLPPVRHAVHIPPDDNKTDPAGNAGDRIACGIVTRIPLVLPV